MRGLENKVVVAAGAATGIGAATARRLAQEGAKVVVGDFNLLAAEETAAVIRQSGGDATAVEYDQGNWESVQQLIAISIERYGRIDGLFPNAINGQTAARDTDLLTVDLEVWDSMIQVGLTGYFYLIRAALPTMLAAGSGVIVCTSSDASTIGERERPAYGAGKAGINALVRHVATRYGREGIRINAIRPFALTQAVLDMMPQDVVDGWKAENRSGRIGTPEDSANLVSFLFSDDAAYVNGQIIGVNGGQTFTL